MSRKLAAVAAAFALLPMAPETPAADQPVVIKAVGTWGNFTNYQKHEGPFWNERIAEAYFPVLKKALAEIYNAKLLVLYPFPSQTLWCNAEVNGIDDLNDKKIRVYATTLGDFVEGAGGTSCDRAVRRSDPGARQGRGRLRDHRHHVRLQGQLAAGRDPCLYAQGRLGPSSWRLEHGQMECHERGSTGPALGRTRPTQR